MFIESRSTEVLHAQSHQLSNFPLIGRPSGLWSPGQQYTPSFPRLQGQCRQGLLNQSKSERVRMSIGYLISVFTALV
jgi:hypothetical protein